MLKKLFVLVLLLAVLAACTPAETPDSEPLPPADSTSESAVNPVEEPVEEPDQGTIAEPEGSVDLGQLVPGAESDGVSDMIVEPDPGIPDPEVQMVQLASQHLAVRLGIDIGEVTLVEVTAQDWPDGSLGCPSPDALYAAVITPGFQIELEAGGDSYIYHTDLNEVVVLCVDGLPAED